MAYLILKNRNLTVTETVEEIQTMIEYNKFIKVTEKQSFTPEYWGTPVETKVSYNSIIINSRYIIEIC